MKLRLPSKLVAAIMAAAAPVLYTTLYSGSSAAAATIADSAYANLGNIMNAGDSISHGVGSPSYRYFLFKILTDNGIGNTVVGPCDGNYNSNAYTGAQYGNATFTNVRAAVYGARSFEISNTPQELHANPNRDPNVKGDYKWTTGNVGADYANSYINNWLGLSNTNRLGGTYSGETYHVDTFMMLIGTNDMLTDIGTGFTTTEKLNDALRAMLGATYVDNGDGTHSFTFSTSEQEKTSEASLIKTWRAVKTANASANVVYMGVPTLGVNHAAAKKAVLDNVNLYNEALKLWCENHGVTYVQSDEGLRDVTNANGAGVYTMFQPNNDQCHLSYQGDLIFGGNIAKAMGYAGRTVGLTRSSVEEANGATWTTAAETSYTLGSGSQTIASDIFSVLNGYTVDFGAVFGDGSDNGWAATSNALSLTIGDGTRTGTLTLTEGYVMWNNSTVLYSKDNHVASDNLRVAYVNEGVNASDGVTSGYYVWLGDMLIGEGLTAGSGSLNGITLSANGGTGTVSNLTWANTAYAPTTTLYSNAAAGFHLTQFSPRESYDSDAKHLADVSFAGIAPVTTGQYATSINNTATGNIAAVRTGDREGDQTWVGAVGAAHTGNVDINFHGFNTNNAVILAVVNNSVTNGNVSVVLDGNTNINKENKFNSSGDYSFHGSYNGSVSGTLQLEVNDATLLGGIQMGVITGGNTIGSTKLIVNKGANIGGDIFGGGSTGTVGSTDITITGGIVGGSVYGGNHGSAAVTGNTNILITGGRIAHNVDGGSMNGNGTIGGSTNVTVEGVTATIGGTITADNVTLRGIADSGFEDGFDKYSRAITATEKLTLDAYTANHVASPITTKKVLATNNTNTTISNLTLTACDITAEAGSALTLEGTLTLGNTATYSGDIRIADGITFSMSNEVAASLASAGYSSGASGYRTLGTASLLTSSDGSRLTVGNLKTYLGTGALEGATFKYDSATGTLSATSDRVLGTTYYVNSAVTYDHGTEAYGATAFVIGNGGNLTLARDLKDGVTIASAAGSTTSAITVGSGVTLSHASVTAALNSYELEEGAVYDYGEVGVNTILNNLQMKASGTGTVKVAFATGDHSSSELRLGSDFRGIADISGSLQFYGTQEKCANTTFYLHDGEAWYSNANTIANNIIFGGTYTLRPGSNTTLSGVLTSKEGDSTQNLILGCEDDKGKTVYFTNAGNANINKVTLAYDNLKLQGVAGSGNDRTLYTGDIDVNAGRTLILWPGNPNSSAVRDAAEVRGTVSLKGTSTSAANITFEDGSVHIVGGVDLGKGGYGNITNTWDKQQYLQCLTGENATLTLQRNANSAGNGGYFHLMETGNFSGTIKLVNYANDTNSGLILHDNPLALASTEVDFTDSTNKALLAFISGDGAYNNNKVLTTTTFTDGTVAGLKGEKGSVKAGTLTINLNGDYTYSGVLDVAGLVLTGTGTQHFDTKNVTFGGSRLVNSDGTGEEAGGSAFTKMFTGQGLTIADGAKLVLDGNVMFTDQNSTAGTYTSAVREMEITGNLQMNVWSAHVWDLRDHTLTVGSGDNGGYLWLKNHQDMTISQGGSLSVGGALRLSHEQNDDEGRYKVTVEANGASFSAAGVELSGGGNKLLLNNSDVTFTRTAGNAETNLLSNANNTVSAGNSGTTISLSDNTLHSGDNGWNLTAIDGVTLTVDGATKLDIADGKKITIGGATVSGSLTHVEGSAGTLNLAGDTLSGSVSLAGGAFAVSGATVLNGTLHINNGTLALSGSAQVNTTSLSDYTVANAAEGTTGYTGTGTYAGSGFLQDTATFYLVQGGNDATITGAFSSVTGDGMSYNSATGTFSVTDSSLIDKTIYYVNSNLDYSNTEMGSATKLHIADGVTLTANANPTSAKKLMGSGTYKATTGTNICNVTATDESWTGIVELRRFNLWNGANNPSTVNLNTLGNANSKIRLAGVWGIDNNWHGSGTDTITTNLILEDVLDTAENKEYAWWIQNGSSGGSAQVHTYKFTGTIEGSGKILKTKAHKHDFIFTGDVSGWTGSLSFEANPDNTPNVTFSGNATTINAAVQRTYAGGNNLTLILGAPTNGATEYQLNNTVTVNVLSAAGQNVVLGSHTTEGGTVTHGNLTLTASSTIGSLTLNDGATANLGTVAHTIGSLTVNDGATVTAGGHNAGTGFIKGTVDINAGGKLVMTARDTMGWESNGVGKITLLGSSADKLATLQLDDANVLAHGLEMQGNAQVTGDGLLETDKDQSSITVSGLNNTFAAAIGQRGGKDRLHLNVEDGGELLVTGKVRTGIQDSKVSALIKEGAGTVTFRNDEDTFYGYTHSAGTTVISSAATFSDNALAISGGLFEVNAAGKAVALDSNVTVTGGAFTLTDGNITLNNASTFTATNSVVTINGGSFTTGTNGITIGNGAVLNLAATANGQQSFIHGSVTVQNGGQLVLTGHDATGWGGGADSLSKIIVEEGGQYLLGFDDSNDTFRGTLVLNGTLAMQQGHSGARIDLYTGSKVEVGENGHGVVAEGVTLKLRRPNVEFNVSDGGSLTINGNIINAAWDDSGDSNNVLRKTGDGEMIINTNLNGTTGIGGITLEAGTMTLNGESNKMGALNISSGALKTFGGEINGLTMSGGSITNNGTLSIGGAAVLTNMTAKGEAVSGFSDGANGFTTTSNDYQLVTNTGTGTVVSTVTSWSVNGATPTTATLAANGVLTTMDKATDGIYYVNEGMDYDGTTATTDMGAATLFDVKAGVQMNVDGGLLAGRSVKLAENATLGSLSGSYNFTNNQIGSLTLTGTTAWVDVSNSNLALKGASGSTLTLNGGKLSVKGAARFGLFNTNVDAGTISVTNDGNVVSYVQVGYGSSKNSEVQASGTLFEFAGGQLVIGGGSIAGFKGLTMSDENASGAIFGDDGATGGNIKLALGGETYTYRGSIANNINLITTGAGTQNFELSGTAAIGKVKTEAGNMAFSGIAATVASGVDLADGTSVTFGNGATITGATLAGTASLNFTGGSSTLTGAISAANTSTVALSNSAELTIKDSADKALPNVTLNGGTMYFFSQSGGRTYTLHSVAVTGANNTIATAMDNTSFHAKVNIENLSSVGDGAELNLVHNAKVDVPSVFIINGGEDGAFNGILHLQQNQSATHNNGRHVAMNINDADVLSNAVISMESVNNSTSHVALGIAVDEATVKGITTDDSTAEKIIFSGSAATDSRDYNGDGATRTLVINTAGGEYTANATIKSNLNLTKYGAGTQTFSGDMSAFNKTLTVNSGTMALTGTLGFAAASATVKTGAHLKLTGSGDTTLNHFAMAKGGTLTYGGGDALTLNADSEPHNKGTLIIENGAVIAGKTEMATNDSKVLDEAVVSFADLTAGEAPYRVLAFNQGGTYNSETGKLTGGTMLNGTIAGLSGHRGTVMADTLTIYVENAEDTYEFLHRYDSAHMADGQTTDAAVLVVNKIIKDGAGTQVIGGEYTTKRGFTEAGLVISGGVEVLGGTLHMKTRGEVTTNFNVAGSGTLLTTDNSTNCFSTDGTVKYDGKVTLHGLNTAVAGTLNYADGSTYITGGLHVEMYGRVVNEKDSNQFIAGLYNEMNPSGNQLYFTRTGTDNNGAAINVLTAAGDFAGTVHLKSNVELNEKYGLQVLGTDANEALANAVVDFTGDYTTVLSFRNSTEASETWTDSKMDGSVAGLTGTNGAVYANNLTINTANGADYTYGGALNVANIVKDGTGTQNISGNVNSFNGTIDVNNGTLAFTGLSSDATNNLHVSTATVNDNGSLQAGRATLTAKEAPMARTVSKTGTVSDAVFAANSLSGVKDETHNGGSITNGLLAIQEAATYTISDMTLTNSEIRAAETQLEMSNINVDANSSVVALNGSTLAGNNRLTLSDTQEVHPNTPLQSNQLSGLTLQNNATLAITLNNEIGADLTNGTGFTITLSGFQWKDLVNPSAEPAFTLESLNETFTVTAKVNGNQVNFDVINAQMIAATDSAPVALQLTVVPEPTTSVLSLLALAGMAARRKRK